MRTTEDGRERARDDDKCCRLDGREFETYDRHLMVPELFPGGVRIAQTQRRETIDVNPDQGK